MKVEKIGKGSSHPISGGSGTSSSGPRAVRGSSHDQDPPGFVTRFGGVRVLEDKDFLVLDG